jgi:hypothetical protein
VPPTCCKKLTKRRLLSQLLAIDQRAHGALVTVGKQGVVVLLGEDSVRIDVFGFEALQCTLKSCDAGTELGHGGCHAAGVRQEPS